MGNPTDRELLCPVPMAPTAVIAPAAANKTRNGNLRAQNDQNKLPGTCPKAKTLAVIAASLMSTPWPM
jgi:hypothetical protein